MTETPKGDATRKAYRAWKRQRAWDWFDRLFSRPIFGIFLPAFVLYGLLFWAAHIVLAYRGVLTCCVAAP